MKAMLLGSLLALLAAVPAMGQTVATCPTATPGVWAAGSWLPCIAVVNAPLPLPSSALVADMSKGPVLSWTLASNVQPSDNVWSSSANKWVLAAAPNFIVVTTAPPVIIGSTATLSWTAPTANTDGTPLTDLVSYNLLMGTSATTLSKVANIPAPATSYAFKGLVPGTYWFAVQAVSASEGASANSTEPSLTVNKVTAPSVPNSPTSVTVTATVTIP
jgi:hypothetical protein